MVLRAFAATFSFLLAVSCNSKGQKAEALYSESSLKDFVVGTKGMLNNQVLAALDALLVKSSLDSAVFCRTVAFLEKPFGNPNSSYRNEELLTRVLEHKLRSRWYDEAEKNSTERKLYLLAQNKVGSSANDFVYITPSGSKRTLYNLEAGFVLLMFYNPECPACEEMRLMLTSSSIIKGKVASGELKILAIYADRDEKTWLNHLPKLPDEWIHGRDQDEYLYKNQIYDVRAIPTTYLLDKQKRVLLKDCLMITKIEQQLISNALPE